MEPALIMEFAIRWSVLIGYGQMVKYAQHVSSEVVEILGNLSAPAR
jgi:hypothetical protein